MAANKIRNALAKAHVLKEYPEDKAAVLENGQRSRWNVTLQPLLGAPATVVTEIKAGLSELFTPRHLVVPQPTEAYNVGKFMLPGFVTIAESFDHDARFTFPERTQHGIEAAYSIMIFKGLVMEGDRTVEFAEQIRKINADIPLHLTGVWRGSELDAKQTSQFESMQFLVEEDIPVLAD